MYEAVLCDSGAYMLASRVAGVLGWMREAGVGKVPGSSMIEVNGVHEFVSI
jgi:hypothetical protein